ncbi:MAG: helix-turn-helix transcriptional regulator [Gemmatimonadales bacterium]|jgi:transcriptional regulator with XRE-family HTH domain
MNDKSDASAIPLGHQIRRLREERGWTLAVLARRVGTSAPALHRYENGWDRFRVDTLRKVADALGARLDVRLVPAVRARPHSAPTGKVLLKILAPLFWDRDLRASDLTGHTGWVLERVLTAGSREQVKAARAFFGDDALRRSVARRGVDRRTRNYWSVILGGAGDAS